MIVGISEWHILHIFKSIFFKSFIKTGILDKKLSVLYSDLMNKRQETDYDDFLEFNKEDVEPLIKEVTEFIASVKSIIV